MTNILSAASLFHGEFSIDWLIQLSGQKASLVLEELEDAMETGILSKINFEYFIFSDRAFQLELQKKLDLHEKEILQEKIAIILSQNLPDNEDKALRMSDYLSGVPDTLSKSLKIIEAGDIFLKTSNVKGALKSYLDAIHILFKLESDEIQDILINTVIKYSRIADVKFDIVQTLSILKKALKIAELYENRKATALIQMHLAKNEWYRSNYSTAIRRFQQGWEISKTIKDKSHNRAITIFSTFFHYWQGRFNDSITIYEQMAIESEDGPKVDFSLLAVATVGYCYTLVGEVAQGFGMLHSMRSLAVSDKQTFLRAFIDSVLAIAYLNIQKIEKAIECIQSCSSAAKKWPDSTLSLFCKLLSAYAAYLQGKPNQCNKHLQLFSSQRKQLQASMWPYPFLLELCWEMENGRLKKIEDLSIHHEIKQAQKSRNLLMSGIAFRYQALLILKTAKDRNRSLTSLVKSEELLKQSGHAFELARTRLLIANQYLETGETDKADSQFQLISKTLTKIKPIIIPTDLKPVFKVKSDTTYIVSQLQILVDRFSRESDSSVLLLQLITIINRVLGAERGGIFVDNPKTDGKPYLLLASRNLTREQTLDSEFTAAEQLILKVRKAKKGTVENHPVDADRKDNNPIRSMICVPIKFKGNHSGVIYHDNRLIHNAFKENDLSSLSVFSIIAGLIIENQKLDDELQSILKGEIDSSDVIANVNSFFGIVGQSKEITRVIVNIKQVAETGSKVLILGETGVGKELIAKAIHKSSNRADYPFVSINCNALPHNLIASELFGHEKGAFSGAIQQHIGRFELAHKGTLFIDEIGEMPLEIQVKLLRVLQNQEFERLGGTKTIRSDFRLITATNRNIENDVRNGTFRSDLFYRLNIFPILAPPLRDRKEDIPILSRYFLQTLSLKMGRRFSSFPDKEMEKLVNHHWPGNVRELENVIERGIILSRGDIFRIPKLFSEFSEQLSPIESNSKSLQQHEKDLILQTLARTRGKIRGLKGAARILDIHPSTLYSRMKKLEIKRDDLEY
ncbi:sigma 54-interacting transcriptional regulator [bacterium]|nr:sigma 54-interacting transcriptional regulator [bacterium]